MSANNKLYPEDQAKVDKYLNRPNKRVEHKPFRPWLLLGVIVGVMTLMSLFSYYLAYQHGVV